jgi:formate dehydrogenase iron-sulfur subunit
MSNGVATLLEQVLSEQAEMSAVELFAGLHEVGLAGEVGWYRNLMPASPPGPGQQYGFEVDLDSCTGCKACVTACHRRNGLDEGESWRSAGLLEVGEVSLDPRVGRGVGGVGPAATTTTNTLTSPAPIAPQIVTTACHHCVEPACLAGCPVNAYEKDPVTGIVVHLDDQCIGCGYCLMTCPYEVPRFNDRLGIVRKCDMCRGRLAAGEAPACVEACPNGAIRVSVVEVAGQREAAATERFLVGAPDPSRTVPSTVYRSKRGLDTSVGLSAGAKGAQGAKGLQGAVPPKPGRSELPLVWSLVLSQLAAGAALAGAIAGNWGLALMTVVLGIASVGASAAHLGRPRFAWRAVLGWRHSWLSREVCATGAFVILACAWAGVSLAATPMAGLGAVLGWVAAAAGLAAIACSVLVYAVTRRPWWRASLGAVRFACTAAVGALAGSAAIVAITGEPSNPGAERAVLAVALVALAGTVVGSERLARRRLRRRFANAQDIGGWGEMTGKVASRPRAGGRCEMAGSADLLRRRALRSRAGWRLGCSLAGALVLADAVALAAPGPGRVLAAAGLALVAAGELVGRSIFFVAVAPTRMPGGRV